MAEIGSLNLKPERSLFVYRWPLHSGADKFVKRLLKPQLFFSVIFSDVNRAKNHDRERQ